MEYKTNDFTCPASNIMIVGTYNAETKKLSFHIAKGYYYPQDNNSIVQSFRTKDFIEQHSKTVDSLSLANEFLDDIGITEKLI